MTPYLLNF